METSQTETPETRKPRLARRPEYKGAEIEVYGFVCWILTFVAYIAFLLWAYLPPEWLYSIGITYYPSKSWAIVGPTWFVLTFFSFGLFYLCLNSINTAPLNSSDSYTDNHSKIFGEQGEETLCFPFGSKVPPISDISLTDVNDLLYT
eukprot:TRINITY_DN8476_c0_g1_i4.p1 TRINITY_DN8476_c0_g1~~TRINITY_DN8476_c0_g1_i4.p1  ORF type:complete len:147 (+),score=10.36 TRINITY_DN8476_c0_g1_i4:31-471(+)